jgi:DNA-binding LytR/AlgR family response regulator
VSKIGDKKSETDATFYEKTPPLIIKEVPAMNYPEVNFVEEDQEYYIPVITRKEVSRVNIRDIFYIETELRVINIYTISRSYRFYGKLDEVVKYLNDNFYRCHKSCVINLAKVVRMEDGVFYFQGEMTLRVGQNNFQHTRSRYIKFLERKYSINE